MKKQTIQYILIIGAGILGHAIAQLFAVHQYKVILYDKNPANLSKAKNHIIANLKLLQKTGIYKKNFKVYKAMTNITFTNNMQESIGNADLIIEAVTEDLSTKRAIFIELGRYAAPHTILASNSSSFLPIEYASEISLPEMIMGLHFFNPPYLLPIVEIIPAPKTSSANINKVMDLLTNIKMKPVIIKNPTPGFVGNRLQFALLKEAIKIISAGIATPRDVDDIVKYGFGRRLSVMGPFEVFDFAGWDTILKAYPNINNTKPPQIIINKIKQNKLGVKSGIGFYRWNKVKIINTRKKLTKILTNINKLSLGCNP